MRLRLQTIYVDLRPLFVKWLGLVVLSVSVVLLITSFVGDVQGGVLRAREQLQSQGKDGMELFTYINDCMRSFACMKTFAFHWRLPIIPKSILLGSAFFGAICWLTGTLWRPEIVAMRDVRINATEVEVSRQKSPTAPGKVGL